VGFLFGMLPLTIAVFFGDLVNPWPYVWIYIGIAMRAAVLTLAPQRETSPSKRKTPARPKPVAVQRPGVLGRGPTG
jgi:hypothetical protein